MPAQCGMALFIKLTPNAPTPSSTQSGTGMIEFLLVAMPLLLTAMGGVEISHWMFTRQAISMALIEASRAGATQQASPQAIANAFEAALAPLYPGTSTALNGQRTSQALAKHQHHHAGALPWHIQLVSPDAAAFEDFASQTPGVKHISGLPTIDNSYQLEQHQSRQQQSWPHGKGHQSGQTIYQANELVLRLTYRYKPLLPGFEAIAGDALALTQETVLAMQSHPVLWPDDPAGRVTRAPDSAANRHWQPAVDAPPPAAQQNGEGSQMPTHTSDGDSGDGLGGMPEQSNSDGQAPEGDAQGDGAAVSSEDNICTNTSPSLTIPNSDLARSSMASLPDFRS